MTPIGGEISSFGIPQMLDTSTLGSRPAGMFGGKPDWKSAIVAALNGFLASKGNAVGAANLRQMYEQRAAQQQAQADESQYQRKRQDTLSDWMTQQQWKQAHPDQPDLAQRVEYLNTIKDGLGNTYAQNYAANGGGAMVQFVDPSTGQRFMMPQQPAPTAPVGKLTPIGGATGSAPSRGFLGS